jgi:outer membrane receptor protein involved in Fe transport
VRLTKSLIVVPAVRWSRISIDNHVAAIESAEAVFSPSLGAVYTVRPFWSAYGTASRGFEAPTPGQYLEGGLPLEPMKSSSVEGGTKIDLLAGRLNMTAAVYRIRRTNIPEADGRGFYRQIGEGASHGVELEAIGRVAPGFGLRGGYAWTSTEVVSDLAGFVGNALPNAPEHKGELWLHYRVPGGTLDRLSGGFGIVAVSDRYTARDNIAIAPGYTRIDTSASYTFGPRRPSVTLVVQNLTNTRYVTSGSGLTLWAGAPRRVAIEVGCHF